MSDRTGRRAAVPLASVLTADALLHLFRATGSTWPAADEKGLSHAVLGVEAPFTPPVLLPLAALLLTASGIVVAQSLRPRRVLRLGTLAAAAGLSLCALAGVHRVFAQDTSTVFHRLNLVLYTPLCALLCVAALRVARHRRPAASGFAARGEDAVRVR
ncbi:DUF3995 domain-containing protein [Streptomyces siamensis]|uniref:DUF3995 domain-containing protein n=1 Tax=Streptomyces siamensis TaxID=1274986 RepID=A0ABP9IIF7_9ACTN